MTTPANIKDENEELMADENHPSTYNYLISRYKFGYHIILFIDELCRSNFSVYYGKTCIYPYRIEKILNKTFSGHFYPKMCFLLNTVSWNNYVPQTGLQKVFEEGSLCCRLLFFFDFAYTFLDGAVSMEHLYISRPSSTRRTLQTLAPFCPSNPSLYVFGLSLLILFFTTFCFIISFSIV